MLPTFPPLELLMYLSCCISFNMFLSQSGENNVNIYTTIITALILFISLGIIFLNVHSLFWQIKDVCLYQKSVCHQSALGWLKRGKLSSTVVICSLRTSQDFWSHNVFYRICWSKVKYFTDLITLWGQRSVDFYQAKSNLPGYGTRYLKDGLLKC